MTDSTGSGPSGLLRVQGTSKLAFGATTAALVTLASGGTAILVNHATGSVATPTSLPLGAPPLGGGSTGADVVVAHPAGAVDAPAPDPTEQAIRDALAERRQPGRRTLTVPLVPVDAPVTPPAVAPPVVEVPSVDPVPLPTSPKPGKGPSEGRGNGQGPITRPVEEPRGSVDPGVPGRPPTLPGVAHGRPGKGGHTTAHDHGHDSVEAARHHGHGKGRHARGHGKGKHAR